MLLNNWAQSTKVYEYMIAKRAKCFWMIGLKQPFMAHLLHDFNSQEFTKMGLTGKEHGCVNKDA